MKNSCILSMRLTGEDKKNIQINAKLNGRTMSNYILTIIKAYQKLKENGIDMINLSQAKNKKK